MASVKAVVAVLGGQALGAVRGGLRAGFVSSLVLLLVFASGAEAEARNRRSLEALQKRYQQAFNEFRAEMLEVADFAEQQSYATDAAAIRQRALPFLEQTDNVDDLPNEPLPNLPVTLPDVERTWRTKLRNLETDYASLLYRLAREALKQGHASFAFSLIREVAYHDPDHRYARSLLGYVKYDDEWTTPFAATMRRRGHVWHERFGWLPSNHVSRYEKGERLFQGRWMSAEKEAGLRAKFENAWIVLTEHFEIHTNESLEGGVELGQALEEYHAFFRREFAAFFNTPQQMQRLFDGGGTALRNSGSRYRIHYYASRDEFIERLVRKQPNIAITNGLYMPGDRVAYFFHDPEVGAANRETMFHEVTHQLLSESNPRPIDVGREANFWLIEGLACYMESFQITPEGTSVGRPGHIRIYWARERLVNEDFFVPMRQFTALGMNEFQRPADIATLQRYYSQASGMAHFFLHYEDGAYRDAFIEHLAQIYSPSERVRRSPQTLETLLGIPFETLDAQYKEYMESLPAHPDADQLVPASSAATE